MAIIVPVSTALDDVKWECFATDEPITSGMEIIKMAKTNPEDGYLVCVPVDRNIGLPKSELVKCKCEIWSDIDDIDVISFLTGGTRHIWAKHCNDIEHCECCECTEVYFLTLKHYPPCYESEKGESGRAGDLVATLRDKNGEGVSGKMVFFYVEPASTNLKRILENFHPHNDWIRIRHDFPEVSYIGYADMDKGVARWNYIDNGCIRLDVLSKVIRDTGENVKGTITAVVFDEKTNKAEQKASVDVELSDVARIVKRPTSTPVYTPIPTPKPTPVRRSTSTESTPAREPTTQEECERWCSSRYGAGTPGIFFSIDGCACRCKEGYATTAEGIVKISIEQCDQLCRDKFGTGSAGMFNSDEMCRCGCSEGYKFNEAKTKCIKRTSTQTVKPTNQEQCERWCSNKYGAGTPGIFFNDACACRCKEGYKLTAEGRKVKITIEQCDQLCLDQFGIGHRGVFSSDEMCKFVCEEGYTLNEAKTRCVKISPTKRPQTPAPTYSYDDTYAYDEVPGFELAFAIAGLLAVAYLLRRRK